MEWFLGSMWFPVIAGMLFGCYAFEQLGHENLLCGIGWVLLSAICGAVGGVFGIMFITKLAIFFFVVAVVTFLVMMWQDE